MIALTVLTMERRRMLLPLYPEKRRAYDAVVASFILISAGIVAFLVIELWDGTGIDLWRPLGNILIASGLITFAAGWFDLIHGPSRGHAVNHVVEFEGKATGHVSPGLYLCLDHDTEAIRELLTDRAGLVISRYPEDVVRERFGIERIPVFWLTKVEGKNTINPHRLEYLTQLIVSFMGRDKRPKTVLLDGMEYLNIEVGFKTLFRFLTIIKDYAVLNNTIVLVVVGEDTFPEKEWALLRREFPVLGEVRGR
ncbi:hypothetical protein A3L11_00200 [Thermococcus siculi]|uniref:DUF835 domain-containing protein n=2 Tax=Thermococcus siculi TaxID=72803 RepID=A0A2Z2MM69_9EURY|nr:hypothetical protein A3L11_00200 [Thermococcus siculi]